MGARDRRAYRHSLLALVIAMIVARPRGDLLKEALRLLPSTLRLLRNLAVDRTLPRCIRVRLWLLFAYPAFPFDLIPDFIPVARGEPAARRDGVAGRGCGDPRLATPSRDLLAPARACLM